VIRRAAGARPRRPAHEAGLRPRIRRAAHSEHTAGWLFVLPAAALIGLFGILPIGWSALLSFQQNDLLTTPKWVGGENYRALIHDPVFRDSVRRTFVYTALFVPISVGGALAIAVLLDAKIRFSRFYRTAVFVPVATSTVATGIIFNWLLDPTYGIANYLLGKVGLGPYGFFQDPDQAMYGIVAMTVWGWLGFDVIIFLAALQGIPEELVEAARLDGAGRWAIFRRIRLPLLSPATLFLIVWSTINALQVFDEIYVTTRGGPLRATTVLVYYIYNQAFELFHGGYAAAVAYALFVITLVFSLVQLWIGNRSVYYRS
jgi:multiple sugar transport system permease protein